MPKPEWTKPLAEYRVRQLTPDTKSRYDEWHADYVDKARERENGKREASRLKERQAIY